MPKLKTKSSTKLRFRVSKKGKVKKGNANDGHLKSGKSPDRKRRLRKTSLVDKRDMGRMKKMMPYSNC